MAYVKPVLNDIKFQDVIRYVYERRGNSLILFLKSNQAFASLVSLVGSAFAF
jgi:hypothetical protein